jgi:glycosyltransferase involved in cell wall biosynthesis
LARHGVEVTALFDADDASRPAPPGADAVAIEHAIRGSLRFPTHLEDAIAGTDVLVLHGGWLLGNVVAGRVCRDAGVPYVITSHGVYMQEVLSRRPVRKRAWQALFERRHLQAATAIHLFFDEERASMESAMDIRTPTITAPNGIDFPEDAAWSGGGGFLLWLGRFDITTKGLDLLTRAIARIPAAQRPQVRLHGPDWRNGKQQMRDLVHRLGVDDWVRVEDAVYGDEKWRLIAEADACIYPSRWDACPVAVSEAAAIGAPILVTRYPLGNFLAAKGAAIQVDPHPESIARGIPRLLATDARDLGKAASVVARNHLSWDAVTRSWLQQVRPLIH